MCTMHAGGVLLALTPLISELFLVKFSSVRVDRRKLIWALTMVTKLEDEADEDGDCAPD